ncbi:MAG: hypothetical protein IH624_07520 [Phycisphaerae bacterium]|nr:hypothetical protein [Phycisphaerae bacterium]
MLDLFAEKIAADGPEVGTRENLQDCRYNIEHFLREMAEGLELVEKAELLGPRTYLAFLVKKGREAIAEIDRRIEEGEYKW